MLLPRILRHPLLKGVCLWLVLWMAVPLTDLVPLLATARASAADPPEVIEIPPVLIDATPVAPTETGWGGGVAEDGSYYYLPPGNGGGFPMTAEEATNVCYDDSDGDASYDQLGEIVNCLDGVCPANPTVCQQTAVTPACPAGLRYNGARARCEAAPSPCGIGGWNAEGTACVQTVVETVARPLPYFVSDPEGAALHSSRYSTNGFYASRGGFAICTTNGCNDSVVIASPAAAQTITRGPQWGQPIAEMNTMTPGVLEFTVAVDPCPCWDDGEGNTVCPEVPPDTDCTVRQVPVVSIAFAEALLHLRDASGQEVDTLSHVGTGSGWSGGWSFARIRNFAPDEAGVIQLRGGDPERYGNTDIYYGSISIEGLCPAGFEAQGASCVRTTVTTAAALCPAGNFDSANFVCFAAPLDPVCPAGTSLDANLSLCLDSEAACPIEGGSACTALPGGGAVAYCPPGMDYVDAAVGCRGYSPRFVADAGLPLSTLAAAPDSLFASPSDPSPQPLVASVSAAGSWSFSGELVTSAFIARGEADRLVFTSPAGAAGGALQFTQNEAGLVSVAGSVSLPGVLSLQGGEGRILAFDPASGGGLGLVAVVADVATEVPVEGLRTYCSAPCENLSAVVSSGGLDVNEGTYQDYADDAPYDEEGVCTGEILIFNGQARECWNSSLQTMWTNCCDMMGDTVVPDAVKGVGAASTAWQIGRTAYQAYQAVSTAQTTANVVQQVQATANTAATAVEAGTALGNLGNMFMAMLPGLMWAVVIAVVIYVVMEVIIKGCPESGMDVAMGISSKRTHFIERYCRSTMFWGGCYQQAEVHCVFGTKLGRMIHEQGRWQLASFNPTGIAPPRLPDGTLDYQALKRKPGDASGGWGASRYNANCRGFRPEEFAMLDFGQMNLEEYFEDIQRQVEQAIDNGLGDRLEESVERFFDSQGTVPQESAP